MPFRGVLHCHCGRLLTGAPSRGKSGKYFYYYKCPITSKHNNISVIKSQEQLEEAFRYMSLTDKMVKSIIMKSELNLQAKTKDKNQQLDKKRAELEKVEADLHHLEKKWLEEQINQDTYNRWHTDYTKQRNYLRSQIDQLSKDYSDTHAILKLNIGLLTDIRNLYVKCNTLQKQELIRTVFDNSLYYENKVYRTPYLIPELAHNELKMKEKGLLIINKKGDSRERILLSGGEGIASASAPAIPEWGADNKQYGRTACAFLFPSALTSLSPNIVQPILIPIFCNPARHAAENKKGPHQRWEPYYLLWR